MKIACRGSGALCALCVLAFSVLGAVGARAEMAEIGGIPKVYVREGAGTEFGTIATLDAGDPVDILDVEGSWTKIQTRDGKVGFVYHKYVVPRVATPTNAATMPALEPTRSMPYTSVVAPAAPPGPAVAAPAVAAPSTVVEEPPPAPAAPPRDGLTVEVSRLRSEIADLKREIQDRAVEMEDARSTQSARGIVSPIPATGAPSSMTASEQSAGALAVGFLALLVGWVLGSAFTRRRSRSQRPRLRF